jgi:hypothetical protein
MDDDSARELWRRVDDAILRDLEQLSKHALEPNRLGAPSEEDNTLTLEKMERINRCRLRYLRGLPMSGEDLYVLKATPREVLGLYWQEGMREPTVEGPLRPPPRPGGIINWGTSVS